ncbi:SDR family NAD(P)-dependent oxidoreductase [Actinomadura rugatobispora]|uniref:SDR family NAD(P)-dependent oxidoreductase n=1 Tax=Actinomadura rugatobispora TaxID=1994 RepID=A0ABW1A2Y5_9ACTN|nr:SDR family oxidoreductase [Actinomadura rugatobispora]
MTDIDPGHAAPDTRTRPRTAVVTGASRGLGLALARELARDGWNLVIDARGAPALEDAAEELRETAASSAASGTAVIAALAGDVADPAHRAALARTALEIGHGVDLLVNNASVLGTTPLPRLAAQPLADLERAFAVNTVAPLALVQALLPALRERGGAVLNITSDAAVEGYETWGGYGATKAALEQLSRVLAAEEPGLAVWWTDPGEMRTRMLREAGEDADAAPPPEEAAAALYRLVTDRLPSGRHQAADLAGER